MINLYKYILFDFDGTLINTNKLIVYSLNETAKKFIKRPLNQNELFAILGKPLEEQAYLITSQYCSEAIDFYKYTYKINQHSMIRQFPGVTRMLRKLKKMGCMIGIVSSKGRRGLERCMSKFNFSDYIDTTISAYDVEKNKPSSDPALKAIDDLKADKEQSILIGDSPYDIQCGKNAGIRTGLVKWTIFPLDKILDLNPDYCFKNPRQIVNTVSQSVVSNIF